MVLFRRRMILTATAATIAATGVFAQSGSKPRVALLFGGRESDSTNFVNALLGELRSLGYQEGRTVEIDTQYADYSPAQAERLAVEIAGRKPAVIVTSGGGIEPAIRLSAPIPVVFVHSGYSAFPDSGHVLSYGPERLAVWRRTAHFVDRIIKGAHPSSMPIELPTVFELVINRRSATAMDLVVPPQLMVHADRVID